MAPLRPGPCVPGRARPSLPREEELGTRGLFPPLGQFPTGHSELSCLPYEVGINPPPHAVGRP